MYLILGEGPEATSTPAAAVDLRAVGQTAVVQQRRQEFAFEDECWYDLARTSTLLSALRAQGKAVQKLHYLLPIPQC